MKIIPFDFFDGKTAGEFHSILPEQKTKVQAIDRNIVKDDCKLIALSCLPRHPTKWLPFIIIQFRRIP
jgi:hypothetical protein